MYCDRACRIAGTRGSIEGAAAPCTMNSKYVLHSMRTAPRGSPKSASSPPKPCQNRDNAFTPRHRERRDFTAWRSRCEHRLDFCTASTTRLPRCHPPSPAPQPQRQRCCTGGASSQILSAFTPRRRERTPQPPHRHTSYSPGLASRSILRGHGNGRHTAAHTIHHTASTPRCGRPLGVIQNRRARRQNRDKTVPLVRSALHVHV
jgi:hypothetical protein